MSEQVTISVQIASHNLQIKCTSEQTEQIKLLARRLDDTINTLRKNKKIADSQRIYLMAALLLLQEQDNNLSTPEINFTEPINKIKQTLEATKIKASIA